MQTLNSLKGKVSCRECGALLGLEADTRCPVCCLGILKPTLPPDTTMFSSHQAIVPKPVTTQVSQPKRRGRPQKIRVRGKPFRELKEDEVRRSNRILFKRTCTACGTECLAQTYRRKSTNTQTFKCRKCLIRTLLDHTPKHSQPN